MNAVRTCNDKVPPVIGLDAGAAVSQERYGRRARKLARLTALGLPVPRGCALSFDCVRALAGGADLPDLSRYLDPRAPLVIRSSPQERVWGGAAALRDAGRPGDAEVAGAVAAMARSWASVSARVLREARQAPPDAGLGLILQEMAGGHGAGVLGAGTFRPADGATGTRGRFGRYTPARGADAVALAEADIPGPVLDALERHAETVIAAFGDVFELDFVTHGAAVWIVDARLMPRGAKGAISMAVGLARRNAISREDALLRIDPLSFSEALVPQIAPGGPRDVICRGLGASSGAASGRLVFTAEAAQAAHGQGEASILMRIETGPEDIRGMHAARGVATIRGGMSSHAAVIARGIGLPCVVGARDLRIDIAGRRMFASGGRIIAEGDLVTIDGTRGEVIAGAAAMTVPALGESFRTLLGWADAVRDLGVRANADTPLEARMARDFGVDGLGLCRTEHMFFDETRLRVMREMIFADDSESRRDALGRLLEMQRADFIEMFDILRGRPVTIRLLDPPLHEFLPKRPDEIAECARSMGLDAEEVALRARRLAEINPMLGMRGVRLGVARPEIYEMQARAIFEAAIETRRSGDAGVVPEIMVPLVSANREVELTRAQIDAVARLVQEEMGAALSYRFGVMVETPRAALRAGDLAANSAFLSFGTNDLTQMAYGLSRDDAGRFMHDYVAKGVFPEDPFLTLDVEGVGELLVMAARRGRARNADLVLGLCGEHGGDPASIRFCSLAGFDYVSCSPFRVPQARLAAAQAALLRRAAAEGGAE